MSRQRTKRSTSVALNRRSPRRHRPLRLEPLESRQLLANAGAFDPTFGFGGRTWLNTIGFSVGDAGADLAVYPTRGQPQDGKILIVGSMSQGGSSSFAVARFEADGRLDTSFGPHGTGIATIAFGNSLAVGTAIGIDGSNRIVVGGWVRNASDDFALARLDADGKALDASFGSQGRTITDLHGARRDDYVRDLAIDPRGGSIVLVGSTKASGKRCGLSCTTVNHWDFAVARYSSAGHLRWSSTTDFYPDSSGPQDDEAYAVAIHPISGQILVAGEAERDYSLKTNTVFVLAAYAPANGGLEWSTFTQFANTSSLERDRAGARALAIAPSGEFIVAAGYAQRGINSDRNDVAIATYYPAGGNRSKGTVDLAGWGDTATAVAVQSDGKIVIGGQATFSRGGGLTRDFAILRFGSSLSSPDPSFGQQGGLLFDFGDCCEKINDLVVLPDGRILASGLHGGSVSLIRLLNDLPDRFEPNNTAAAARDLAALPAEPYRGGLQRWEQLSIHTEFNDDWYRLTTDRIGDDRHFVRIELSQALGDLDLELYRATDLSQPIRVSRTVADVETISLAGLGAGNYLIRVLGVNGSKNPQYALSVNAPVALLPDKYDASTTPNNSQAQATPLGTIRGRKTFDTLSIHVPNDTDWFRFVLAQPAGVADYVRLEFDPAFGELNAWLVDSRGVVVAQSVPDPRGQSLSLDRLAADTYHVMVHGLRGGTHPRYSLVIHGPGGNVSGDRFEPNDDSSFSAFDLGTLSSAVQLGSADDPLSIHRAEDQDWFKFTLQQPGRLGHYISLQLDQRRGDLDLELYDFAFPTRNLLRSSRGAMNSEYIGLEGLAAGTYLVRVAGVAGATTDSYSLLIHAPGDDWAEPNDRTGARDDFSRAYDLRVVSGFQQWGHDRPLSIDDPADVDWFKFQVRAEPTRADYVQLTYPPGLGDLAIRLFDSDGRTELAQAQGSDGRQRIDLLGLGLRPNVTYYLQVEGIAGATNASYSLAINAPGASTPNEVSRPDWIDELRRNDTLSTAHDLGTVQGWVEVAGSGNPLSLHVAGDEDWFAFTLPSTGQAGQYVQLSFRHVEGDLDLALTDGAGQVLRKSEGFGDVHTISLAGLASGRYFIRVFGHAPGQPPGPAATNPQYRLTLLGPDPLTRDALDTWKSNDHQVDAVPLGRLGGVTTLRNLSIDSPNDVDWFRFTTAATAAAQDGVTLTFSAEQGDLDLFLYDDRGVELGRSEGIGDVESILLQSAVGERYPAGTYFLKVVGHAVDGVRATNPSYTLTLVTPPIRSDWLEARGSLANNDVAARATDLRQVEGLQVWRDLSIVPGGDVDWYQFTLLATGTAGDRVEIAFDQRMGDLDMALFHPSGQPVLKQGQPLKSETGNDREEISLEGLAAGSYLVQVYGYRGASNTDYSLLIQAPLRSSELKPDWAEPNSLATQPRNLHQVTGTQAWEGLSIDVPGDVDWFRFSTAGAAVEGHAASIVFARGRNGENDLDLALFHTDNTAQRNCTTNFARPLASNQGDRETISLEGLPAGTYCLRVTGRGGTATNSAYQLLIHAPPVARADWAEQRVGVGDNNQPTRAVDLRQIDRELVLSDLSLAPAGDVDWFRFVLPQDAAPGDAVRIDFNAALGDLNLELYSASLQRLDWSDGAGNFEELLLAGGPRGDRAAGVYFVKVLGATPQTRNAAYSLTLTAGQGLAPDGWESRGGRRDNDAPSRAFELRGLDRLPGVATHALRPNASATNLGINTLAPTSFPGGGWTQLGGRDGSPGAGFFEVPVASAPVQNQSRSSLHYNRSIGENTTRPFQSLIFGNQADRNSEVFSDFNREFLRPAGSLLADPTWLSNFITFHEDRDRLRRALSPPPTLNFSNPHGLGLNSNRPPEASFGPAFYSPFFAGLGAAAPTSLNLRAPTFQPIVGGNQTAHSIGQQFLQGGFPSFLGGFGAPAFNQGYGSGNGSFGCLILGLQNCLLSNESQPSVVLSGLSIHEGDTDWFRLVLEQAPRRNDYVSVQTTDARGPLELTLWGADGVTILNQAAVTEGAGRIELAGLPAGNYLVSVRGWDDPSTTAEDRATNSNYALLLRLPTPAIPDLSEPNNSFKPEAPQRGQATDLRAVEGRWVGRGFSIHQAADVDWFVFDTRVAGTATHQVRIDFRHADGDLDLRLFDGAGRELARSETTNDFEVVSLANRPAGTYYVQVLGYRGATNPNYTLSIDAPESALPTDRLEPDNSLAAATRLDDVAGLSHVGGLTIHTPDPGQPADVDHFVFTTVAPARASHSVSIRFENESARLTLDLLDQNGAVLSGRPRTSSPTGETIELTGLPAGKYFARVRGVGNATNRYSLSLDAPTQVNASPNDWTVLVYMTASDLSNYAFEDLNELELAAADLPASVNFAVLLDQSRSSPFKTDGDSVLWTDTGRAIIRPDTDRARIATTFERIGERNTGDPATLEEFVRWAIQVAPAKRYGLVLWDHGAGLEGLNFDDADDAPPDQLTIAELAQALQRLAAEGQLPNARLDLLAFEACLMAVAEVEHRLAPFASVIVGSQEVVAGAGYDHRNAFSVLQTRPDLVTATGLAESLVVSFERTHRGDALGGDTHSATDSSRWADLESHLRAFTNAALALNANHSDWTILRQARGGAASFLNHPDYRDLGQFLRQVAARAATPGLAAAAGNAAQAVESLVFARTQDRRGTSGLSIYLPQPAPALELPEGYATTFQAFLGATRWLEFLQRFVASGPDTAPAIDWAEENPVAARATNLHRVAGVGQRFSGLSLHAANDEDWFRFFAATEPGGSVRVVCDDCGGSRLIVELFDARVQRIGNSAFATAATPASLPLVGQSEYLVRVRSEAGALVRSYSLLIDAPERLEAADEWIRGNDVALKAYPLGVLRGEDVFSGLVLDAGQADWFEFSTPRNYRSLTTTQQRDLRELRVRLPANVEGTAELYRLEGSASVLVVPPRTAAGEIVVPYESGSGQAYRLSIRSAAAQRVPYAIHFVAAAQAAINLPPVLTPLSQQRVAEGALLELVVSASDPDGPNSDLRFHLEPGSPPGMTLDAVSGRLQWSPGEEFGPGVYPVTVRVTDQGWPARSDRQTFEVLVEEVNSAPVLTVVSDAVAYLGQTLMLSIRATDSDIPAQELTYSLAPGAPTGATIDAQGIFRWTPPPETDPGTYGVTVRVRDSGVPPLGAEIPFSITVPDVALHRFEAGSLPLVIPEGGTLRSSLVINDSFIISDLNVFLSIRHNWAADLDVFLIAPSGRRVELFTDVGLNGKDFLGTFLDDEAGRSIVAGSAPFTGSFRPEGQLSTLDGENIQGTWTLEVTDDYRDDCFFLCPTNRLLSWGIETERKLNTNRPPVLSPIGSRSVEEGSTLVIPVTAIDPDAGQTLTFSLDTDAPAGATIDPVTGILRWTPREADGRPTIDGQEPHTFRFTVRVKDDGFPRLSDSESFLVTVLEVNSAPIIEPMEVRQIPEGSLFSWVVAARDPDEPPNKLRFELAGAPPGAAIDPETGLFTWTPAETQGPGAFAFTVRVTDDGSPPRSAERSFSLLVTEINQPPHIFTIPDQFVSVGSTLQFLISAADPDVPAQGLSFALIGQVPTGAAVHASSGLFTWTPSAQQLGGPHEFTVRVSDDGDPALSREATFRAFVASLGQGSIQGRVYEDKNHNRRADPDEPGLAGVEVFLDLNANGLWEEGEPKQETNVLGEYRFGNLAPGTYEVRQRTRPGWSQTYPGLTGDRLLAGTGSDGAHPYHLVELRPGGEGPIGPTSYHNAMDVGPDGQLYAGYSNLLRRVDPQTGAITTISRIETPGVLLDGLAFAPDGSLFTVSLNVLYRLNPATGSATMIGEIPLPGFLSTWNAVGPSVLVRGIDFAPDGTLYAVSDRLHVLDPATGNVLQSLGSLDVLITDIDFGRDGILRGVSPSTRRLYRIDTATGQASSLGMYGSDVWSLASEPVTLDGLGRHRIILVAGQATAAVDFGNRAPEGNLPPLAREDTLYGPANQPWIIPAARGVLANDFDPDGDPLTAVLASGPSHGTLTLNADGSLYYQPAPGFQGDALFSYRASDGVTLSDPVVVRLGVGSRTWIVNSTSDHGDGVCDAYQCTLREAILAANANPATDQIWFNISPESGGGPQTIRPLSPLPAITSPVILDATTQPGYEGRPLIELDGSLAGVAEGLYVTAGSSTIRGFVINRFAANGIRVESLGGNTLQGNFLGTDRSGSIDRGNGHYGVYFGPGAGANIVGTNGDGLHDASEGNLISGNDWSGIGFVDSDNNLVAGNLIGTDISGTFDLGNAHHGIWVGDGSANNLIGTNGDGRNDALERNVISGNDWSGVAIARLGSDGNIVAGNFIGTDIRGATSVPNSHAGVDISAGARSNRVGTDGDGRGDAAERNVISGNAGTGVGIFHAGTSHNVVAGNFIGTDALGRVPIPNGGNGVWIAEGAAHNRIGTNGDGQSDALERNILSGNMFQGVEIRNAGTTNNVVAGNYIGTDVTGTYPLGNRFSGVRIHAGASGNRIGSDVDVLASELQGNVISANYSGIEIAGTGTDSNIIAGNRIGVSVAGDQPLGNHTDGVLIRGGARLNWVGVRGVSANGPLQHNVISGNGHNGVRIIELGTQGNTVAGNLIGVDVTGTLPLGNRYHGVSIDSGAQSNLVGTNGDGVEDASERNILSANGWSGVGIYGSGTESNTVAGNYIGTDITGTQRLGNGNDGVSIYLGARFNRIGTNGDGQHDAAERNLLSANNWAGVGISSNGTNFNVVSGNWIGTDVTGLHPLGNRFSGVALFQGAQFNRVGTNGDGVADAVEGNVIADNGWQGVMLSGGGTRFNQVLGNWIGTSSGGTVPLGNRSDGVVLFAGASLNQIGGVGAKGNTISFNQGAGIRLLDATTLGNSLRGNRIHSNAGLEIDIGNSGASKADHLDEDDGPNQNQNSVTLLSVTTEEAGSIGLALGGFLGGEEFGAPLGLWAAEGPPTLVRGNLNSTPNTDFVIDFYASRTADSSGTGQAERFLGSTMVRTDASGLAPFEVRLPSIATDELVTATATDPQGNTSEFSIALGQLNHLPEARDDAVETLEDTPIVIPVLDNDEDVDGFLLLDSLTVVRGPEHGTAEVDSQTGRVTYRPAANFHGVDFFEYTVRDHRFAESNVARVMVTTLPDNDPPVARDDAFHIVMNNVLHVVLPGVLANDTDVDGDPLVIQVEQLPQHGQLTWFPNGSFRYEPHPQFVGTDSFRYRAGDGAAWSAPAAVALEVRRWDVTRYASAETPLPIPDLGSVAAAIDVPHQYRIRGLEVTLTVDHPRPADLRVVLVAPDGTVRTLIEGLSDSGANLQGAVLSDEAGQSLGDGVAPYTGRYRPAEALRALADASVGGRWTLQVFDEAADHVGSLLGWTLTVDGGIPENEAPVIEPLEPQLAIEEQPLVLFVRASDPDGPPSELRYRLGLDAPAGATLDPLTGRFHWIPEEHHGPGRYLISLIVTDQSALGLSAFATLEVTVQEANRGPVLQPLAEAWIDEGQLLTFTAVATDPDLPNNVLTYRLGPGAPAGAFVDLRSGVFSWVPAESQGPGSYVISIIVSDNAEPEATAEQTFIVHVHEVNAAPEFAAATEQEVLAGRSLSLAARAADADLPANRLRFQWDGPPPAGAALDADSGAITWDIPLHQPPGDYPLRLLVEDDGLPRRSAAQTFVVRVLETLGEISGRVFHDRDASGLPEPLEEGLRTRTVFLDANQNGQWDEGEARTTTDATGAYRFGDLPPGVYSVTEMRPRTWGLSPSGQRGAWRLLAVTIPEETNSSSLVEIGTTSGDVSPWRTLEGVAALDRDAQGRLFAAGSRLWRIDPATSATTLIGPVHSQEVPDLFLSSISFAPDGSLYGLSEEPSVLYRINPLTGAATAIGSLEGVAAIEFASDGRLFGIGSALVTISPATAEVLTIVAELPPVADVDFAPDGFLYAVRREDNTLLRINVDDGSFLPLQTISAATWGLVILETASPVQSVAVAAGSKVANVHFANRQLYPWHGYLNPLDVNFDFSVSPIDGLLIINELNQFGSRMLPPRPIPSDNAPPYLDVSADGFVSPLDVLLVINYLNQGGGEGEPRLLEDDAGAKAEEGVARLWNDLDWLFSTPWRPRAGGLEGPVSLSHEQSDSPGALGMAGAANGWEPTVYESGSMATRTLLKFAEDELDEAWWEDVARKLSSLTGEEPGS